MLYLKTNSGTPLNKTSVVSVCAVILGQGSVWWARPPKTEPSQEKNGLFFMATSLGIVMKRGLFCLHLGTRSGGTAIGQEGDKGFHQLGNQHRQWDIFVAHQTTPRGLFLLHCRGFIINTHLLHINDAEENKTQIIYCCMRCRSDFTFGIKVYCIKLLGSVFYVTIKTLIELLGAPSLSSLSTSALGLRCVVLL